MTEGYKVKKIFLWSDLVRPDSGVNIQVDWTKLSALPEGWTHANKGYSFNNWLSVTGASSWNFATFAYPLDMSKLNKLTIESNWTRIYGWNSWIWWDYIWITNLAWHRNGGEIPLSSLMYQKAYYSNASQYSSNGLYYTQYGATSGQQLISFSTWSNYGNWNLKMEIDFQTGKIIISSIAPYTYSYEHTLSSSILADIKTWTYVCITLFPASNSTSIVYNTSIVGE